MSYFRFSLTSYAASMAYSGSAVSFHDTCVILSSIGVSTCSLQPVSFSPVLFAFSYLVH